MLLITKVSTVQGAAPEWHTDIRLATQILSDKRYSYLDVCL